MCDSSLVRAFNSLTNELSHVFVVKQESGFWENTGLNATPCTSDLIGSELRLISEKPDIPVTGVRELRLLVVGV